MGWIMATIMPPIKVIVHDHNRMSVITQRTPPDIMGAPAPVNPGWPPNSGRDPVPTEIPSPVPSSVMCDTPSPGIVRHPGPSDKRIPAPSSVVIRPPIMIDNIRNPDISVRPLVNPTAVISQLVLVLIQLRRKIIGFRRTEMEVISLLVPL